MAFTLVTGLHIEQVASGYLVLIAGRDDVVHLTGAEAAAFKLAQADATSVPEHLVAPMAGLVTLGIVNADGWSRRRVLQLGGIAAAATVTTLALPSVAAATSPPDGDPGPGGSTTTVKPAGRPRYYISQAGHQGVNAGALVKIDTDGNQSAIQIVDESGFQRPGPNGVAADANGVVYVADPTDNTIVKVGPDDVPTVFASGFSTNSPMGVAVDAVGNLLVADTYNHRIVTLDINGSQTSEVAFPFNEDDGGTVPTGVTVGPDGLVYVTDSFYGRVVRMQPDGSDQTTLPISGLSFPFDVAVDTHGNVYVASYAGVTKLDTDNNQTSLASGWVSPTGVTLDASGSLYVCDASYSANRVVMLDADGNVVTTIGTDLNGPWGIAVID